MKLLIDGYNFIRYITQGIATQQNIEAILVRLRRYSRFMGHEITVVFDGGNSVYKYQTSYHQLSVWYSGIQETADDVIKHMLPHYKSDEVILISDDRQLNYAAQECNIVSISPAIFYQCLQEKEHMAVAKKPTTKNTLFKTSSEENEELDALMAGMSMTADKGETAPCNHATISSEKTSKIDRRLKALMRKL